MIIHDCIQGTQEWLELRAGIPTASNFDRIITPKTRKLSSQSFAYMCELAAESILGPLSSAAVTPFMERGSAMEASAIAYYQFQRDVDTKRVGFITDDHKAYGCSPERLVGEDGGLEIKCPSAGVHVQYLLDTPNKFVCQVQGCMLVTGRKWWDVLSYSPTILPSVIVRFERDEAFIDALSSALDEFLDRLNEAKQRLHDLIDRHAGSASRDVSPAEKCVDDIFDDAARDVLIAGVSGKTTLDDAASRLAEINELRAPRSMAG